MDSILTLGGVWWTPESEERFGGTLKVDSNLLTFSRYANDAREVSLFINRTERIPVIWGCASDGTKVTLLNCKIVGGSARDFDLQILHAKVSYIFIGGHLSESDIAFPEYHFKLTNLNGFCDLCQFEIESFTPTTFVWKAKEQVEFPVRDDLSIRILPVLGSYPLLTKESKLTLTQSVVFSFLYTTPVHPDVCMADIKCLIQLFQVGIDGTIAIESFECRAKESHDQPTILSTFSIYMPQHIGTYTPCNEYYYLFFLQNLIDNQEILKNWFSKFKSLKTIIDLYSTVYSLPHMPVEILFLNIVQALEIYHTLFKAKTYFRYRSRANKFLELEDEVNIAFHSSRLYRFNCDGEITDRVNLFQRLSDLFLFEFDKEFITPDKKAHPYGFIQSVVDTRHYLTHHNPSKEGKALPINDLNESIQVLRLVMEYYLLRDLGFHCDYTSERISNRIRY